MRRRWFVLAVVVLGFGTGQHARSATETQIDQAVNILIVRDPSANLAVVQAQTNMIDHVFANSWFVNTVPPVAINIINDGSVITIPPLNGSFADKYNNAKVAVSLSVLGNPSIRDSTAADLVLVYVDQVELGLCGYAPQEDWGPPGNSYIPDPLTDNLDLRGADDDPALFPFREGGYYLALVSTEVSCSAGEQYMDNAAHEIFHLFGAGHYEGVQGLQPGLHTNSKALIFDAFQPWMGTRTFRTVMGRQIDDLCTNSPYGGFCRPTRRLSDRFYLDFSRMNSDAIDTTAVAVANYRRGDPVFGGVDTCFDGQDNDGDGQTDSQDPECQGGSELPAPPPLPPGCDSTVEPFGVYAFRVANCASSFPPSMSSPSQYRIGWAHSCPGQVSRYEVWAELPPGFPPSFRWSVSGFTFTTDALIDGTSARVLIRACGPAGCSDRSGGPIVIDVC